MKEILDILFTIFHSALVLFMISGWAFEKTRKIHLYVVSITLIAWLVIGFIVGTIGYCPLTDWHWDIKRSLGERDLPSSFIKYMVDKILRIDSEPIIIDAITGVGMLASVILTITFNFRTSRSSSVN